MSRAARCCCSLLPFRLFQLSCFDAAGLHPLNQHLLTAGVHTCICHSQHKKTPHMKGLGAAFFCRPALIPNPVNCAPHLQIGASAARCSPTQCARRMSASSAACGRVRHGLPPPPVRRIGVDAQSTSVQWPSSSIHAAITVVRLPLYCNPPETCGLSTLTRYGPFYCHWLLPSSMCKIYYSFSNKSLFFPGLFIAEGSLRDALGGTSDMYIMQHGVCYILFDFSDLLFTV